MLTLAVLIFVCSALLYPVWRWTPHHTTASVWRLWVVFLLSASIVSTLVLMAAGGPGIESTFGYARWLFSSHVGTDSWMPMLRASEHLRAHPDVPVFPAVFFEQHVKFQYPLTALLVLDLPIALFHLDGQSVVTALQVLSRLCVPAIGVVFYLLVMGTLPAVAGAAPARRLPPASTAALVMVSLLSVVLFYPLARSEYHGQIQTAMTLAAGLALLAWQRGHPKLAGFLIALCCVIKPQWVIVILWAALRRQWTFAAAAAVTTAVFAVIAVFMYGLGNMLDYVPVVSFLSRHGESYFINQSVNGLMNRLLFNGANLEGAGLVWSGTDFPPFHPVVYGATLVSSILILGTALLWNRRKRPTAIDLALIMLALTLASPIAWDHHYGVLFPILGVMFAPAVLRMPWGRWTLPGLWVMFVLTSQSFNVATNLLAATHLNVLQSYLFFGALLVFALLLRLSTMERDPAPPRQAVAGASST